MGFLKKIGNAVKKNVSFKNLVKVGGLAAGAIPGVGGLVSSGIDGLSAAHQAKKEAKAYEAANNAYMAEQMHTQAARLANQGGASLAEAAMKKIGTSAIEGAMGHVGNQAAESTLKTFFKKHWQKVAIGVVSLVGLVLLLRNRNGKSRRR